MIFLNRKNSAISRQHGLSLLELLVSLVISSFMVLGIMTLYAGNIRTAQVTQNVGESAVSGGFGSLLLTRYLRFAGYQNFFMNIMQGNDVLDVVSVANSTNNADADDYFDTIAVEFYAPGVAGDTYAGCGGGNYNAGAELRETFSVNANGQLQCTTTAIASGATQTSALVQGVQMFQVQYGMAGTDSARFVSSYVNSLPSQLNVNARLRSIRFQMLVRSTDDSVVVETQNRQYQLYDSAVLNVAADASYKLFGTTIAVNNSSRGRIMRD